jgi:hypothetical protein
VRAARLGVRAGPGMGAGERPHAVPRPLAHADGRGLLPRLAAPPRPAGRDVAGAHRPRGRPSARRGAQRRSHRRGGARRADRQRGAASRRRARGRGAV